LLRVALVFEFGSLNGGENSMLTVVDQLQDRDVEFVALAPGEGPLQAALESREVRTLPFDVRDAGGHRRSREQLLEELRVQLAETNCELVHANSLSMGRLTGAIADELPMPTVAHLRDILKLSQSAVRDLNRNACLVAVSKAARKYHIAQGMKAELILTMYNGVETERFQPLPADGELRRELGLLPADFLVLTVGQIGLRKGQDILAEAAVLLSPRLSRAHYLWAGQRCSNKEESLRFEEQVIRRLSEGGRLHLLGYREDMPRLMNAADVLVHPAHQEPLGRVLLEAAAAGLPIVATDVGGTAEILRDGESALLVPPADPQSLAEAILKLAQNPDLRSRLANKARQKILTDFPIETAASNLHALWNKIVREHSRRAD
jgi:glycosyltransferase involved in cell wall biosynthesis